MSRLPATTETPRYVKVADALRQAIFDRTLPPRSQVDTEPVLARRYRVSVGTIRKAQDLLIQEGLLIKKQGSGTFVADDAHMSRQILWVCGLDIFSSDLSPYYSHFLQYCRQNAARADLNVSPALLSNDRPEDAQAYCSPQSSRNYLGYVFVGCEYPKHQLLRYVVDQGLPHVHVGRKELKTPGVVIDYNQGFETGIRHLLKRGHRRADVLILDPKMAHDLTQTHAGMLSDLGRKVRLFSVAPAERMSQVEANGYQAMRHLLLEQSVSSGLLVMDDILARGVTRAMLEYRDKLPARMELVVMGGIQEMMPMGFDASYLVHDVAEEARQAMYLLSQQIREPGRKHGSYFSQFSIKTAEQLQALASPMVRSDALLIHPLPVP